MGAGINTYFSAKMLSRMHTIANLMYPKDDHAINKLVAKAVKDLVEAKEDEHGLRQPDEETEETTEQE